MDERWRAIEDLYRRRYRAFRYGAAAVTGDLGLAHDAVQEGFSRALARRSSYRGGSLEAWVWRIVLRAALDDRRRRGRELLEQSFDAELIQSHTDPELAAAVRALPPRRRLVVFLRYYADLSYDAIAETCGLSAGTVAATLAQARDDLRRALETEGVEHR